MKNADDQLSALWKSARSVPHAPTTDEESLAPGTATRIASRWASGVESPSTLAVFERITACCLVPCVIAFAAVAWLRPAPTQPDLMSALFNARIEIEDDFPF